MAFLQKMTEEINKLEFSIDPEHNLTPEQLTALKELSHVDTIVVKQSDKCGPF